MSPAGSPKQSSGPGPKLSIVIPARDEERTLPATLESVAEAVSAAGVTAEVIVVNDGSIDRTADVARQTGARVIDVELHNIGAVRNAGARSASGEILVFLDADTLLPAETLQAALREIDSGTVGGGAKVTLDRITPLQRPLAAMFTFVWQGLCKWAAGCFIFCRRDQFEAVGGFDEQYFAAEERFLSTALKGRGRFVILKEHVVTSGRKLRLFSTAQLLGLGLRAFVTNPNQIKQREGLEFLYDAPREPAEE